MCSELKPKFLIINLKFHLFQKIYLDIPDSLRVKSGNFGHQVNSDSDHV